MAPNSVRQRVNDAPLTSGPSSALLSVENKTLFLKFTGSAGLLKAEKDAFASLCPSVRSNP